MSCLFELERPEAPWADYGDILFQGMTDHLPRRGGLLQLERTGPFMPPITFPGRGSIVVTDAAKRQLMSSGLIGFAFQPVLKARIVAYDDWRGWDRTRDEPNEYPASGEPENYILLRPHDETVATAVGDVWEIVVRQTACIIRGSTSVRLVVDSWNGDDLFGADGVLTTYASRRARDWLCATFGAYVSLVPAPIAE